MTIDPWLLGRGELPPHLRRVYTNTTLVLPEPLDRRFRAGWEREGLCQAAGLRAALTELLEREEPEP